MIVGLDWVLLVLLMIFQKDLHAGLREVEPWGQGGKLFQPGTLVQYLPVTNTSSYPNLFWKAQLR